MWTKAVSWVKDLASRFGALVRRYRRKWKQVPFHDRVNIYVATSSLFVGLMAIVLTVVTLRMAGRQEAIAIRQEQLAEKQTQIADSQLKTQTRQLQLEATVDTFFEYTGHSAYPFTLILRNRGLAPVTVISLEVAFNREYSCVHSATNTTAEMHYIQFIGPRMPAGIHQGFAYREGELTLRAEERKAILTCDITDVDRLVKGYMLPAVTLDWEIRTEDKYFASEAFKGGNRVMIFSRPPDGPDGAPWSASPSKD